MTTLREAAQMALNDLEALVAYIKGSEPDLVMQVPSIEALRAALAQQENQRARDSLPLMVEALEKLEQRQKALAQPEQEPLPEKSKGSLSHEENKRHNKMILDKFYKENAHLYKAQPEQEPVAWIGFNERGECREVFTRDMKKLWPNYPTQDMTPLYTAPPQREWQGLTDEDLSVCDEDGVILARYWEAKLREKNT